MSFSLQARFLPSISSYEAAHRFWEKADLSTGSGEPVRAIVNRRDTSKTVRKNDDDSITFRYHRTDMVTYHSPTLVTVTEHDSVSSRVFLNAFLPDGISANSHRGDTWFNGTRAKGRFVTFRKIGTQWHPDEEDVIPQFNIVLDRKRAAEIRKHFKPLLEWRAAMARLKGEVLQHPGRHDWHWAGSVDAVLALREMTVRDYKVHGALLPDDDQTINMAYARGGALKREPLPLGVIPKRPKYDGIAALIV